MKTVEYKLKSKPEKSIYVPAEFAGKAEGLVELAKKGFNSEKLSKVFNRNKYPCLLNRTVLHAFSRLEETSPDSPNYPRLQDELYIISCIHGNKKNIFDINKKRKVGEEAEEAEKMTNSLLMNLLYLK